MSRRAATSPIGTGEPPRRASSPRARTAYADFAVMTSNRAASLVCGHDDAEETRPVAAATGANGRHLLLVGAAEPQLRAWLDRPRGPQDRARQRVRAALLPVVARASHEG